MKFEDLLVVIVIKPRTSGLSYWLFRPNSYWLFGPWLLVNQPRIKAGKFLVSLLVQDSVPGILFFNLPGKVLVPAFQKFWTSCFLVGSWLTWFCSYPTFSPGIAVHKYSHPYIHPHEKTFIH